MILHSESHPDPSPVSKIGRSNTDPLWIQDYYLATGHTEKTHNGTATFVRSGDRVYAVTCRHIMAAVTDPDVIGSANWPGHALHIDIEVLNLSFHTAEGLQSTIKAPAAEYGADEIDIGIAELDPNLWEKLERKKGKVAIDLDRWVEPSWKNVKMCCAVGYPNEHKDSVERENVDRVASPMLEVVADLASTIGPDARTIVLQSSLPEPHGKYFSGMSGGAIYADDLSGTPVPVGIVFEGFPSSGRYDNARVEDTYLTANDIFVRGMLLTPTTFANWLRMIG